MNHRNKVKDIVHYFYFAVFELLVLFHYISYWLWSCSSSFDAAQLSEATEVYIMCESTSAIISTVPRGCHD